MECWNFKDVHVQAVVDVGDEADEVGAIGGSDVALCNDPGEGSVQSTLMSSGQIVNLTQIELQFPEEGLQTVRVFFFL
jgi:hypothetical protein